MTSGTFEVIKQTFWGNDIIEVGRETYNDLTNHAVVTLPASIISRIKTTTELRQQWNKSILMQVSFYAKYSYAESHLPITVPYTILKGTSAAQYYPHPEFRAMGDIDIITRREDFDQAYKDLLNNGYRVCKKLNREVSFAKDGIIVELHHYFASLNDINKSIYMDELILNNITPSHVLPDMINGLVLLEHIDQHLENGIGLRQIIDWMMFVNTCLPDEKWEEFKPHAQSVGLVTLAIVVTRMCEIYLGLPERKWCELGDEDLCKQLMDYIMACGNFGNIRADNISVTENVFYASTSARGLLSLLQKRGEVNWMGIRSHALFKPFAWLYQAFRYLFKGFRADSSLSDTLIEYKAAKQRDKMFKALGVKQASKGLVVYKNGKYIKQ